MHVERKRIDVSRVDSKDMDNLMPRSPLELEDVLYDLEQLDASQRDAEFLRELAPQRCLGRLTELDTATDQSMKVLPRDRVRAVEYEYVTGTDRYPQ